MLNVISINFNPQVTSVQLVLIGKVKPQYMCLSYEQKSNYIKAIQVEADSRRLFTICCIVVGRKTILWLVYSFSKAVSFVFFHWFIIVVVLL